MIFLYLPTDEIVVYSPQNETEVSYLPDGPTVVSKFSNGTVVSYYQDRMVVSNHPG